MPPAQSRSFRHVANGFMTAAWDVLQTLLAKRLPDNRSIPNQNAADWSAALNAALMLPLGALLSLIFHPLLARVSSQSTMDVLVDWQKPTPSGAASHYMLGVLFCFLLSTWAAMSRPLPTLRVGFGKTVGILFVLFSLALASTSLLCQVIIYDDGRVWPAWIGLVGYVIFLGWYKYKFSAIATDASTDGAFFNAGKSMPTSVSWLERVGDICAILFIFLIFWPYSIDALLDHWNLNNPHAISYLIGPAQLSLVPGNLPNVNFFSQYSIGAPYVFSWLLSSDLAQVIERYLYCMTIAIILYCAAYYYLLSRLCTSRFWGFVFTLLMIALLANAIFWTEPSSAPVRFLFFPVCAIVVLRYGLYSSISVAAAAVLGALSIMNNTETGIHTALAYTSVLLVSSPAWRLFFQRLSLLISATVAAAIAMCVLCYGWPALSLEFLVGNLKPLIVYSVIGYMNYPLPWDLKHWTWMQCLVMPGLATLVLALFYYKTWTNRALTHAEQALIFCSAFGLLLLVKFMYRSFMALGHVNSGPLIVVLGFCFVFLLRKAIEIKRWRSSLATGVAFALSLSMFLAFLYTFRENIPGRDIKYATTWLDFPSTFNRITGVASGQPKSTPFAEQAAATVNDVDVALIERYSEPGSKPVWIYADEDWAYLLRARRNPATTVLPIPHILMGHDLDVLKAKFERDASQYVFIERKYEPLLMSDNPVAVFPNFSAHYALFQIGKDLAVFKRKAN
jgi:hypothetical protein